MADDLSVQLIGIEKRFPGVIANHDVNIAIRRGSVHAVIGENGAGKSTLMKTLFGMHRPDAGEVRVGGVPQSFRNPSDAIAAGIGMVHQHFMLAANLTVMENIILGAEPTKRGVIDDRPARTKLNELMTLAGFVLDLDCSVSALGVGERQRVEILKVLYRGARILILDEPTAVLVPQEVDELFGNLKQLVADGATVIFISHKLDEVMAVSDEITVMRQGTTIATTKPSETTQAQLGEFMVGTALPTAEPRLSAVGEETVLELADVSVARADGQGKPSVSHVALRVRRSEIVGVAGVEGNGQFELCQAVLGLAPYDGNISLVGKALDGLDVRSRQDLGVAYIPFDRHEEGSLLTAPLWENLLLTRDDEPRFVHYGLIEVGAARSTTRDTIVGFDVRTPNETVPMFALSGGNQQKLLVGRELESSPQLLIAAHPTRGVDIGAQAAIWDHLRTARDRGLAVLLITADLEELLALSDRIIVMFDGEITAELDPSEATPEILGHHMTTAERIGGRP